MCDLFATQRFFIRIALDRPIFAALAISNHPRNRAQTRGKDCTTTGELDGGLALPFFVVYLPFSLWHRIASKRLGSAPLTVALGRMGDWLLNLPIPWMALVIFGAVYLLAAAIYLTVIRLAVDARARAFKAVSPGMLPPLGIIFGL